MDKFLIRLLLIALTLIILIVAGFYVKEIFFPTPVVSFGKINYEKDKKEIQRINDDFENKLSNSVESDGLITKPKSLPQDEENSVNVKLDRLTELTEKYKQRLIEIEKKLNDSRTTPEEKESLKKEKDKTIEMLKLLSLALKTAASVCAVTGVGAGWAAGCYAAAIAIDNYIARNESPENIPSPKSSSTPEEDPSSSQIDLSGAPPTNPNKIEEHRQNITKKGETLLQTKSTFGDYSISYNNNDVLSLWYGNILKREYDLKTKNAIITTGDFRPNIIEKLNLNNRRGKIYYTIEYQTNDRRSIHLAEDEMGNWSLNESTN